MSIKSTIGPLKRFENVFEAFIFWSRWVQAPMYGGLVVASFIYVYKFFVELYKLWSKAGSLEEAKVMLYVLGLVDITMVINLLVMVTIGGYSIFTSKIDVDQHEDKPLWLEELDAGRLKIKLAASLASISGVHLLKTFIDVRGAQEFEGISGIIVEIAIHLAFIVSALLLAYTEKIQHGNGHHGEAHAPAGSAPKTPPDPQSDLAVAKRAAMAAIHAQKRAEAALEALRAEKRKGEGGDDDDNNNEAGGLSPAYRADN